MSENKQESETLKDEKDPVGIPNAKLPDGIKVGNDKSDLKYYCMYCECALNSERSFSSHLEGFRHKQNEKFVKTGKGEFVPSLYSKNPTEKPQGLRSNLKKISAPIIGLNYIVEFQIPDSLPKYECSLCKAKGFSQIILQHIVSNKHRLRYLKTINEEEYNEIKKNKPQDQTKLITLAASKLEKERGRGTIQVKRIASRVYNAKNSRNSFNEKNKIESRKRNSNSNYPSSKRQNYSDSSFNEGNYSYNFQIPDKRCNINSTFGDFIGSSVASETDFMKCVEQNRFEIDALKYLNSFTITSDADAKTVTEVINSLMHSLIQYKLRKLPNPVRELIMKSIKAEEIKSEKLGLYGLTELKKIDTFMSMYDKNSKSVECSDYNENIRNSQDNFNKKHRQIPPLLDDSFCHAMNKDIDNEMQRLEVHNDGFNKSFCSSQNNFSNLMPSCSNSNTRNCTDDINHSDRDFELNSYNTERFNNDGFKRYFDSDNFRGRLHNNNNANSFNERVNDDRFNNPRQTNSYFSSRNTVNQNECQNTDYVAESYERFSSYESNSRYSGMDNSSWKNYDAESSRTYRHF